MFFIASIARTILNHIYSNNQDELRILENKAKERVFRDAKFITCPNCRLENNKDYEYCEECRTKLK